MNEPLKPPQLPKNAERARRVARLLALDQDYGDHLEAGNPESAIVDALTDLWHLADAERLNFDSLFTTVRGHHLAEVAPWDADIADGPLTDLGRST